MEVTRATFVNLSVVINFDFEKVYVWFFESCSYLSPHLSCGDIYEMLMWYATGNQYFLHTIKKGEISQTEKNWLVTPTMDLFLYYFWEPEMYCCDALCVLLWFSTGPLFTKWTDILPQDLAKPRSWEIQVSTFPITLTFARQLSSMAAEIPVKFQSETTIINIHTHSFEPSWDMSLRPLTV